MLCTRCLAVVSLVLTTTVSAELRSASTDSSPILSIAPARPSVRDFGAKGDGKTDDTAAIEAAVKAGTGAVYFPAGEYRLTRTIRIDLNTADRLSLVGTGDACVIMAGPGPAFAFIGTHEGTGDPQSVRDEVWEHQRLPIVTGIEIRGENPESIGLRLEKTIQATRSMSEKAAMYLSQIARSWISGSAGLV